MSARNELAQKRRFAALFVNGPAKLRGSEEQVNRTLGTSFDVLTDTELRSLIEGEGGVALLPVPDAAPVVETVQVVAVMPRDEAALEAPPKLTPTTDAEWLAKANEVLPYLIEIATGKIKATASQVAAAKEVVSRAYGRVAEKQSDKKPAAGVVILPALGDAAHLQVCPNCGHVLRGETDAKDA